MSTSGSTMTDITLRPFDPAVDMAAAAGLLFTVNEHDEVDWRPTEATLADEWQPSPRFDPAVDVILAWSGDTLVGLAEADWRKRGEAVTHEVHVVVHPTWRRRGIGRRLLGEIESHAGRVARTLARTDGLEHRLTTFFEPAVPGAEAFATMAGYRPHTYGFLMRRQLDAPVADAPLPAGLEVRAVTPDQHRVIWDADTEAFLDHDEPAERLESDYQKWFGMTHLDTSLWRVAWAGDEVAGSVMTFIWPEENEAMGIRRAWLEHVSVRRPWRRIGLASALIADTLRMLQAMGMEDAVLGVHGENPTGAVGVYERAGFAIHKRWVLWRKDLADGQPRRT
ncbi:MAG TPA: GNAT family N-acetyltransferase [Candidatus Polarisedimenticolia bacterium]|nr:GNAT family N-acetyltransferase [Candidatus Polarisedimenticolia bacterium]